MEEEIVLIIVCIFIRNVGVSWVFVLQKKDTFGGCRQSQTGESDQKTARIQRVESDCVIGIPNHQKFTPLSLLGGLWDIHRQNLGFHVYPLHLGQTANLVDLEVDDLPSLHRDGQLGIVAGGQSDFSLLALPFNDLSTLLDVFDSRRVDLDDGVIFHEVD